MYADRLLRYFVWLHMKDVLAHVVVNGRMLEGLIIALHQDFMAFFKRKHQELILSKKVIQPHRLIFFYLKTFCIRCLKFKNSGLGTSYKQENSNLHLRNTSLETWQECGEAGSEDKSQLPILVLVQCVAQTGVLLPPCPYKHKQKKQGIRPDDVKIL